MCVFAMLPHMYVSSHNMDISTSRRKYYASVNSMLHKCRFASEIVKLELFEKQCLPIILYNAESMNLSVNSVHDNNVAVNSVYRKIFLYNKWESVKPLMYFCGKVDARHLIDKKVLLFYRQLKLCANSNPVTQKLFERIQCNSEVAGIERVYGVSIDYSTYRINKMVFDHFGKLVNDAYLSA
jgi:hypothetical protein